MTPGPIPVIWKDGAFTPATERQRMRCQEQFKDGHRYLLVEHQERSLANHNHYFVCLHEAWVNLPEDISHEFTTFEKFRATGLIATGFYNERQIICPSEDEARRMAAFVTGINDLAIVSVHGCAVVARTPKSQSKTAMGKAEFHKSKEATLAWAAEMANIDLATLVSNANRAA